MERGRPDMTVYTFEVPADSGRTMAYPDEELWTMDYREADAYAREKGYLLIENEYKWQDSNLLEDYTPPEPLDLDARYTIASVPGVVFVPIGYETGEDGTENRQFAWLHAEGEEPADLYDVSEISKIPDDRA